MSTRRIAPGSIRSSPRSRTAWRCSLRLARHDADRIAVGRRVGAGARADIRGPAGAVFDHDRLPPAPVQLLAEDAHEDVAGAAGAHRHDRLDRPARIVLRPHRACERHNRKASDETTQAAHTGVLPPRFRAVAAMYGGLTPTTWLSPIRSPCRNPVCRRSPA